MLHLQLLQWQQGCCHCSPSFSLLLFSSRSHNSLILLSHNASIYRHFMAALLALLSTLVAAKLQLIQQWWLPTPPLLQQRWLPIVNGWCQPFAAHAMATKPNNHPLCHSCGATVLLLLQHRLASCSSSKLTILRASVAEFTGTRQTFHSSESPKHTFSHTKGSLQPDGLPHHI